MIVKALEISLIITAIYMSMRDGMIFGNVRLWLDIWFGKAEKGRFVSKPIYNCLICMGFWWGLAIYFVIWGFDVMMFPTAFVVVGINTIIDKIIHFEV